MKKVTQTSALRLAHVDLAKGKEFLSVKDVCTLLNCSLRTIYRLILNAPNVWAISYVAGGNLVLPEPIYSKDKLSANGPTNIAEAGDNAILSTYLTGLTGIFTPLSPVLVVVYEGAENLFYKTDEKDRGWA